MTVLSVISTKGGVGKSTLSKFLAITLEERGKTVCLIDLCQNGSVSTNFLQDRDIFKHTVYDWLTDDCQPSQVIQQYGKTGIYFIPSNETIDDFESWAAKKFSPIKRLKSIEKKVQPLKELFDYIIFDTHPSENSDLVSYAICASDYCVIPLETDLDSKLGTRRSVEIIEEFREETKPDLDYGIVANKVSQTNGKLRKQLQKFIDELVSEGVPAEKFLGEIRHSDIVSSTKNEKVMLNEYKNKYAEKIMSDFRNVTRQLTARIEEKNEVKT